TRTAKRSQQVCATGQYPQGAERRSRLPGARPGLSPRSRAPTLAYWPAMTATLTDPARDGTASGPRPPRRRWSPRFRGDIEGLRGVAVLLVVAFHLGVPFLSGGFVGVDVFFVLSGFLITGLLVDELRATGRISLHGFYARRIRRLLPMATLVLAATAAATYALVPAVNRGGVGGDIVAAALSAANWRFAAESTQYMADVDKSPLLHYWSLSVEEQFYVVW